jgi:phosphonate transport system ATP-binding protein
MDHVSAAAVPVVRIDHLTKTFQNGRKKRLALKNISIRIMPGEIVALIGASGSGKSTMLRHMSGLTLGDETSGLVEVLGSAIQDKGKLAPGARASRADIGFIFQQFNIVDRLPLLTNVLIGALGRIPAWRGTMGWFTGEEKQLAMNALCHVGMSEFAWQRSSTLSGGQQQRAAIARALAQKARIILADEPIASLDPASARRVMETLKQVNQEYGITVIVSLHQVDYAFKYCERIIALKEGEICYDGPSAMLTEEMLHDVYGEKFSETGVAEERSISLLGARNAFAPATAGRFAEAQV